MKLKKVSGIFLASLIAVGGLGFAAAEAGAKNNNKGGSNSGGSVSNSGGGNGNNGFIEGTCNTADVFAGGVSASACGNFTGNDSRVGFIDYLNGKSFSELGGFDANLEGDFAAAINALDGSWSLLGKSDSGGDGLQDIGEDQQSGNWDLTAGTTLDSPFVVVLKASTFYSAYLFDDVDAAISSGTFNVKGITKSSSQTNKYAALSHMSIYSFVPRIKEEVPSKIPEPTVVLGLLAVAGLGLRRRSSHAIEPAVD